MFRVINVHRKIPLTGVHGTGLYAMMSVGDFDSMIARGKWWNKAGYAYCRERGRKGRKLRMHRLILDPPSGVFIDHKNRNGLDNRRENLRLCTRSQNAANSRGSRIGLKGVRRKRNRWVASIHTSRKRTQLGSFATAEEAARAYDKAAIERFGEFACLNCEP